MSNATVVLNNKYLLYWRAGTARHQVQLLVLLALRPDRNVNPYIFQKITLLPMANHKQLTTSSSIIYIFISPNIGSKHNIKTERMTHIHTQIDREIHKLKHTIIKQWH